MPTVAPSQDNHAAPADGDAIMALLAAVSVINLLLAVSTFTFKFFRIHILSF
jgi:hypothetical protein